MGYDWGMAKQKTSIALQPDLLARLDRLAKQKGRTRTDLIESFIERGLGAAEQHMVESFRMVGLPSQFRRMIDSIEWRDEDGPIEFTIRVPLAAWEEWLEKTREMFK